MTAGPRRGVTLLELLVALVVGGVVVTLAAAVELRLEGALRTRAERAGAAATLRASLAVAESEWGSLGGDPLSGPDLAPLAGRGLAYRGFRGFGAVCRLAPDTVVVEAARFREWRRRDPDPSRDSLLLFRSADSTGAGEGWLPLPLLAGPLSAACPGGGGGLLLVSRLDSMAFAGGRFPSGGAVRWFESSSLAGYASSTGWQLGLTGLSAGATVQPVAGPLVGAGGVVVGLVDRSGAPSGPAAATGVTVLIGALGVRELAVARGRAGPAPDSAVVLIPLRNQP